MHPVRDDRPAALRHARVQRRDPLAHAGGRRARPRRHPLRAVPPVVGGVHAVARHDPHRPAPLRARRVDERRRRSPSTRRASPRSSRAPATAPRSIGKAHFEPLLDPFGRFTENRLATRRRVHRDRPVARRDDGAAPRLRPPRARDPRGSGLAALLAVAAGDTTPRRSACTTWCSIGDLEVSAAGGGDTGAPQVQAQRDPARVVPHRLGRGSHDRVARRSTRTTTGSAG